jgi:putative restriction endonuclease
VPTDKTWQKWLERLYNLRRDKRGSHERPHKPVLLLSIIDVLDRGLLRENLIPLNEELVRAFKRYFAAVRQEDDKPTIENPFFFLSGDGFWKLVPNGGGFPLYQAGNATAVPSIRTLKEAHGEFDQELWSNLFLSAKTRQQLREALIARYFPEFREKLAAITGIQSLAGPPVLAEEPPGRDAAFRHTILEIYDYRCCACGVRVKLSDALTLVQAAHIVPFGISRNDKPDNGLALCPNHHWAMDPFLIAPCPGKGHPAGIWRVNSLLDDRVDDQKELLELSNRPVIKPLEEKFYPAADNLKWREEKLDGKY